MSYSYSSRVSVLKPTADEHVADDEKQAVKGEWGLRIIVITTDYQLVKLMDGRCSAKFLSALIMDCSNPLHPPA